MSSKNILMSLCDESVVLAQELLESKDGSGVEDLERMNSLINRTMRYLNKGDEGLIELYEWLVDNNEISYEDALLLLFDYLGIRQ